MAQRTQARPAPLAPIEARTGSSRADVVDYASPLGRLPRVVDRLVPTYYLTRLLTARNDWIAGSLSPVRD